MNSALIRWSTVRRPSVNYQVVRWLRSRKPFWLGIAKSKKFVIPEPKVVRSLEETKELRRIINDYECQMNSLLKFVEEKNPLLNGNNETLSQTTDSVELMKKIEDSYLKNNSWNAASAKLREERLSRDLESFSEKVQDELAKIQKNEKDSLEKIEKLVLEEKEKSKFFITPENLEETIDKCLNNVIEYNFAIDLKGNKYLGKDPILKMVEEVDETKMPQIKEEVLN